MAQGFRQSFCFRGQQCRPLAVDLRSHMPTKQDCVGAPIASRDSLGCPAVCPPQTGSWLHLGSDKLLSQAEIPETLQSCTLLSSLAGETGTSTGRGCVWDHREVSTLPRPSPPRTLPTQSSCQDPGPRSSPVTLVHLLGVSCGAGAEGRKVQFSRSVVSGSL